MAGKPEPATSSMVNPEMKIADEKTSRNKGSSKIEEAVIFGIAYHVLDLEFEPEPDHPGFLAENSELARSRKGRERSSTLDSAKAVRADPGRTFDPYLDAEGADGAKPSDGDNQSSFQLSTEEEPRCWRNTRIQSTKTGQIRKGTVTFDLFRGSGPLVASLYMLGILWRFEYVSSLLVI
jgi:hypothetical protein